MASPITVQSEVCVTLDHFASISRSRPPGRPGAKEDDAGICIRRMDHQFRAGAAE